MYIPNWVIEFKNKWGFYPISGAGGSKTQVVSSPPAPKATETAADVYKARAQYDPLIARQEFGIQQEQLPQRVALETALMQQYAPQLSQVFTDVQRQQLPQLRQLQEQLFPQQTQVLEAAAGQALAGQQTPELTQLQQASLEQALAGVQEPQTPLQQALSQQALSQLTDTGLTPEQQTAQEAIRQREIDRVQRLARGRAQLGGQLFGGRAEQLEGRAVGELGQAFAAEDINRIQQQRQQSIAQALGAGGLEQQGRQQALVNAFAAQQQLAQQALPFLQILFPQVGVGQPNVSPFKFTSTVPSPNAQLQSTAQLLGQQAVLPGQSNVPGIAAGVGSAIGGIAIAI